MSSAGDIQKTRPFPIAADQDAVQGRREPDRRRPIMKRADARYGLALVIVTAAEAVAFLIQSGTGQFSAFPFYAAVVAILEN